MNKRISTVLFMLIMGMLALIPDAIAGITVPPGYKTEIFADNLDMPKGLRMNERDELFLIESGKHRIMKVTPDGTMSIFAQSGPGAPLDFHSWYIGTYPTKMDFDAAGNLFAGAVGGYSNPYNPYGDVLDTIFRISPEGTVTSVARQRFSPNYFYDIEGLAIGPDGFLYIGDTWSPHDILKVDLRTNTSSVFASNVLDPSDLLFDKTGSLYACLTPGYGGKQNIYQFAPDGTRTLFSDGIRYPSAIAWGPEGYLYVLDASTNSIYTVDPATKAVGAFASGFYYPIDIEFDSQGNLYVAEPCLGDLTSRISPVPACYGHVVKISKSNRPPVAAAGHDRTMECAGPQGSAVTLDSSGSSDPDGDALTYSWIWDGGNASGASPVVALPLGVTTITLTVDDGKGGTSQDTVAITVQDTIPPSTIIQGIAGTAGTNGWYVSGVIVRLEASDNCSGVKEIRSPMDGVDATVFGNSALVSVAADGTHGGSCFAVDNAGNSETSHPLTVNIDKTAPLIATGINPAPNAKGWNNGDTAVAFTCSDAMSGVASCAAPVTAVAETSGQVINGTAVDQAGNSATASVVVNIDKTPPVTAATLNGNDGASCYSSDAAVALSATDCLSGIAATRFRVNSGPWQAYVGLIAFAADGAYVLGYGSQDNADNNETEKQITFTVDKKAPEAVVRFDTATRDIKVFNSETGTEASYIALSSKHEDDADDDDDDREDFHHEKNGVNQDKDGEHQKEFRQYTLLDCANNTLLLTLLHKQAGHETKVRVLSMQYNNAPAIESPRNRMHAEYSAHKDGTIRELEQKIGVKKQFEVEAKYSDRKHETKLKTKLLGSEQKETKAGMVILELVTERGGLTYRK